MAKGTGLLRRACLLIAVTVSVVMVPQLFKSTEAPATESELEVIAAADASELLAPPLVGWATAALAPALESAGASDLTATTAATAATVRTATTTAAAPSTTTTISGVQESTATTTTTTPPEPPPPTTTTTAAPAPRPSNQDEGEASWYDLEGSEPGVCAHRTIAFGTVLTVTKLDTGRSINCTVGDRGPWVEGRMLDLHKEDFAKLAHPDEGVIQVRIEW